MNETSEVRVGYKADYYRFYKKNGLTWNNVKMMLNYGVGIAFTMFQQLMPIILIQSCTL